ncbi:uncharacterized protein LOC120016646 isoform X2 [Tripterygium wilfordii]|uniref:uncharacterized protein LOC120016646 isoform X2 n=1 Tax=Tripterygium wilfordii TaxID=458696 RepID=UPI0018F8101F|nr:uncharacterized protein LOC120016646 isoform X2 [Tripterygium wilfordii]
MMGFCVNLCGFLVFFTSWLLVFCSSSYGQDQPSIILHDSINVSATKLDPYDWSYIRVKLPPFFSSTSIAIYTDDHKSRFADGRSKLPIICFRDGGPPLPDVYSAHIKDLALSRYAGLSSGGTEYIRNMKQCYPLQRNVTFELIYGQIPPGDYYVGMFNGIGLIRTQSKMINRGPKYTFNANIIVERCSDVAMRGHYCNQTIQELSCLRSGILDGSNVACRISSNSFCHRNMDPKVYSISVPEIAQTLMITAENVSFNQTSWEAREYTLTCYARYNAVPERSLYDHHVDISMTPLVIQSVKVGTWYFVIQPVYQSNGSTVTLQDNQELCYSMEWEVLKCPQGKSGSNCTWQAHVLQGFPTGNSTVPFIYYPEGLQMSAGSYNFPLEPLLSNSLARNGAEFGWTYFFLNTSQAATGRNIHIQILSATRIHFEIYVRYGGLPSLDMWDYRYSNFTANGNNDSMFKLYDITQERINFYILYPREGPWTIGLRHLVSNLNLSNTQTTMSVSIEICPNQCSGRGTCHSRTDATGSASVSYCYCQCNRNHGGFDCSFEIVSRQARIWHSFFLIASNAAAILPALFSLRRKAYAEWIVFMSSGVSSALYHACDVGTWCALSFHVLQFMDFWLSFMAVGSTVIYIAFESEVAKRALHSILTIVTVLLALNGMTRSRNVVIVLSLGALGLLVGWLMEACTRYKSIYISLSSPATSHSNIFERRRTPSLWISNLVKTIYLQFHWSFVLLGFIALSLASTSWLSENSENYWLWHSLWHIAIYTCSFFFLRSKAAAAAAATQNGERQVAPLMVSELAHLNPVPSS